MLRTIVHKSKNAIRFKNANTSGIYIVLGGTEEWPDEPVAPVIPTDTIAIDDPLFAIKATVQWVTPDEDGTFTFVNSIGEEVVFATVATAAEVITLGARYVVVSGFTLGENIGDTFYRQLALCTGLVPTGGHTSDPFLEAVNVSNWGDVEVIEYRSTIQVLPGTEYGANILLPF